MHMRIQCQLYSHVTRALDGMLLRNNRAPQSKVMHAALSQLQHWFQDNYEEAAHHIFMTLAVS